MQSPNDGERPHDDARGGSDNVAIRTHVAIRADAGAEHRGAPGNIAGERSDTEPGAAPVVGIVLLVGIVTILAGVVGALAFSAAETTGGPDQAVWHLTVTDCSGTDDGLVRITHRGGQQMSSDPLELRYVWHNNSTVETQWVDIRTNDPIGAGTHAHVRRVDEPHLIDRITLLWNEDDSSYALDTFDPQTLEPNTTACPYDNIEPGFIVQGDESFTGDCDGSVPTDDSGHGNDCDRTDEDNPGNSDGAGSGNNGSGGNGGGGGNGNTGNGS